VQLGDLSAQGFEFGAFVQGQFPGRFAGLLCSFSGDPLAQRLGADVEFAGDFGDGAAGVDHQPGGLVLVLGAEGAPRSLAAAGPAGSLLVPVSNCDRYLPSCTIDSMTRPSRYG
jgi:hypothetical protein